MELSNRNLLKYLCFYFTSDRIENSVGVGELSVVGRLAASVTRNLWNSYIVDKLEVYCKLLKSMFGLLNEKIDFSASQ